MPAGSNLRVYSTSDTNYKHSLSAPSYGFVPHLSKNLLNYYQK